MLKARKVTLGKKWLKGLSAVDGVVGLVGDGAY